MPNWKKVIVSGSDAVLNTVTASAGFFGTASWATNATSASFARTASFVNTLNQDVLISGSLTVGAATAGASENTLTLGPKGTNEGGQLGFQAGTSATSASMLDMYQDGANPYFRLLRGSNATSDAVVAQWNTHTKQMFLPAYVSSTSFTGTPAAFLAVDTNGAIITTSGSGGSGLSGGSTNYIARWASSVLLTTGSLWDNGTNVGVGNQSPSYKLDVSGDIRSTGAVYANANGTMYFRGGDDAEFWDINTVNTVGIYGQQDQGVASIKLGSGGGTISGRSGSIGVNTTTPNSGALHVSGGVFATSFTGSFTGSLVGALTGTASFADRATSASRADTASFLNVGTYAITSSWAVSASQAITASYVLNAVSSSFASTASFAPNYVLTSATASMLSPYVLTSQTSSMSVATASLALRASGSLTGSLLGTASWATNAITAANATNVSITGDNSGTAFTLPLILGTTGTEQTLYVDSTPAVLYTPNINQLWASNLQATGSLFGTASWANNAVTASVIQSIRNSSNTTLYLTAVDSFNSTPTEETLYGVSITVNPSNASLTANSVTASFTGSLTGSLFGTASWATNAVTVGTASWANNAVTASRILTQRDNTDASYFLTFVDANNLTPAAETLLTTNILINPASRSLSAQGTITSSGFLGPLATSKVAAPNNGLHYLALITASGADDSNRDIRWTTPIYAEPTTGRLFAGGIVTSIISASIVSASAGITGSLFGTASWADNATSASFAVSSSRAVTSSFAISASWAPSSPAFPYIGTAVITGSLIVSGANGGINTSITKPALYDTNNVARVVWGEGTLMDTSAITSVDWQTRYLQDAAETVRVDWQTGILNDSAGIPSVDWENRVLSEPSNTYVAFEYSNNVYTQTQLYNFAQIPGQVQKSLADGPSYAGQIIQATIDVGVTNYQLVFLDTDGTWKGTQATVANKSTKMLGIAVSTAGGYVLIEGDIGVSDDNSQGGYVAGADHGLPVYVSENTGEMTTTQPSSTGAIVRIVGHIYCQSTTDTNLWTMKFRPSNDWYEQ